MTKTWMASPRAHIKKLLFYLLPCFLLALSVLMAEGPKESWVLGPFLRPPGNPVITPKKDSVFNGPLPPAPVHWEALHTFNPAAVVRNGKICVLYRAEDDTGKMVIGGHTSRVGLAVSNDGIHFQRDPEPVLYPANDDQQNREWKGGCEDPRIVEALNGTYVMTYTQWNGKTWDAAIATSKDLRRWTKHGPAFATALGGKYRNLRYKSAGILTKLITDRLIATKIGGKYWMYWGEGEVHLATSQNLIDWVPVEDSHGNLVSVLAKRPGLFDSSFPEVGPPPVLTDRGILVIYNGKNSAEEGDKSLGADMYSAGQALFAADDPSHLLARLNHPFFQPELPYEKTGQYAAGDTFVEGLVYFKNKWFIYYGCADSLVGVAVFETGERVSDFHVLQNPG
jgi:predicted GH43/DUF377 family glycosyl hydrolase